MHSSHTCARKCTCETVEFICHKFLNLVHLKYSTTNEYRKDKSYISNLNLKIHLQENTLVLISRTIPAYI